MKEYWVNVYDTEVPLYKFNAPHNTELQAILCSLANTTYCMEKLLYRIHVKMKEPKLKYEPPFIGMKLSNGDWI